jgi:negative regulator of flagellin synthesis FlgM
MRIDPTSAASISAITTHRRPAATPPSSAAPQSYKTDSAQVSGDAQQVRRAHAAAASSSDVRAEKVANIKAQIEAGTYKVDTNALAEKLLNVL